MRKKPTHIPTALAESDEFRELTPEERKLFEARFEYVSSIVDHVAAWLSGSGEGFKEFMDTLEVDLAVSQNLPNPSNADQRQTSYLIHSSWTFDTTVAGMQRAITPRLAKVIDSPTPPLNCSMAEFRTWLKESSEALKLSLESFSKARSLSEAMAAYISMDILLALLLVVCYKARLNASLLQQST